MCTEERNNGRLRVQSARKGRVRSLKRNGSLRDVGFYLLIAVVLLMTIFALRGGMGNQEKVTYAQVPAAGAADGEPGLPGGQYRDPCT